MIRRPLPKVILLLLAVVVGFAFFRFANPSPRPPSPPKPNPFEKPVTSFHLFYELITMVGMSTIVIDDQGTAYYQNGIRNESDIRKGLLPKEQIQKILNAIQQENFYSLNDEYKKGPMEPTEAPYIVIMASVNNTDKKVESYTHSPPKALLEIEKEIMNSVESIPKFSKDDDSTEFCKVIVKAYYDVRNLNTYTLEDCKENVSEVLANEGKNTIQP